MSQIGSALADREDGDDLAMVRSGSNPASLNPPTTPSPATDCPAQFGNTDVRVMSLAR